MQNEYLITEESESMKERLLEFVRYAGLPVYQFEKLCGLSNAYIKNMSKGIGADKLERILNKFPELNKQWLLYGEGNMLVEQSRMGTEINIGNSNMERKDKLVEMYNYALSKGFCTNKKSFAEYVGINPSNISKIFHDTQGRYLTNSTLLKINGALGNTFSQDWLLTSQEPMFRSIPANYGNDTVTTRQREEGITGAPPSTIDMLLAELKAQRESSDNQISRLLAIIENMTNKQK